MATKLVLLSRLAAPSEPPQGTRIAEARQDLHNWSRHASELPWRRRTARREARRKIAAARTWKYQPALKDGMPVRFIKTIHVKVQ